MLLRWMWSATNPTTISTAETREGKYRPSKLL
jgi:hypothetical protein